MRLDIHQYGVFDGDVASMSLPSGHTPPLKASSSKFRTTEDFFRWIHSELQGSRHVRHNAGLCGDTALIPMFRTWCGVVLRELLHA